MKIKYIFYATLLVLCASCTSSNNEPKPPKPEPPKPIELKITLSANKESLIADGKDSVTFKVITNKDKDVTDSCSFNINEKEYHHCKYATTIVGAVNVIAEYKTVKSNGVTIICKKPDEDPMKNIVIKSSSMEILADGADIVELSLYDTLYNKNLTDNVVFKLNGKTLEGNIFSADKIGDYKITATYYGKEIRTPIIVKGVDKMKFLQRVLVEDFTSTECTFCPTMIRNIKKKADSYGKHRVISVCFHLNMEEKRDPYVVKPDCIDMMKEFEITGLPTAVFNRKTQCGRNEVGTFIDSYLEQKSGVGIALEASANGSIIEGKATVRIEKEIPNSRCLAILIENGLVSWQIDMGRDIDNFTHNHVYRSSSADVTKGTAQSFVTGEPTKVNFSIPIKETKDIKNAYVVFMVMDSKSKVLNVNEVKIGNRTGYN